MLEQIAIFLAAAVLIVPFFKKIGLGAILGYLTAGILIGPWGLGFIQHVESTLHFSEFGVVLLLFIIGLELKPSRLWVLRRSVFGLGAAQVLISTLAIAVILKLFVWSWTASLIIGVSAALSSTAFVLQTLAERNELNSRFGRNSFSILLFQDIAVIPLLVVIPLLNDSMGDQNNISLWYAIFESLLIISLMVAVGRTALRYLFRGVAAYGNTEIFTAAALLVVISTALLMQMVGLTMSLGAFLAGLLLADSEFRHQIEIEIEPFKGLLLGLFFMAVGMSVNVVLIAQHPVELIGLACALLWVKFIVLYAIAYFAGDSKRDAFNLAIMLPAGGEFAFVLLATVSEEHILAAESIEQVIVVITLSMLLSPLLILLKDRWLKHIAPDKEEPEFDEVNEENNQVVIIGFGRFGQISARILHMRRIPFTALDANAMHIDFVRRFGNKVYYGDATRLKFLRSAQVDKARIVLVAIRNIDTSLKIIEILRKHFPHLKIYARAHNRIHTYKLMELEVTVLHRDTYFSGLEMAKDILKGLDIDADDAESTITMFRKHDRELIKKQQAIYKDEKAMIDSVERSREELQMLFESIEKEMDDSR